MNKGTLGLLLLMSFRVALAGGSSLGGVTGGDGGTESAVVVPSYDSYNQIIVDKQTVFENDKMIFDFSGYDITPNEITTILNESSTVPYESPYEVIVDYSIKTSKGNTDLAKEYIDGFNPKASADSLIKLYNYNQPNLKEAITNGFTQD